MPYFIYDATIPASSHNPSDDQPIMQTNAASIDSIISEDHWGFNAGGMNFSGYHKVIRLPPQVSDPAAIVGIGQLYTKTISGDQQLFYQTGNGVVGKISNPSGITIQAAVNFVGATAVINNSYNIASVVRNSTGNYTITYTTALPTANYYMNAIGAGGVGQLAAGPGLPSTTKIQVLFFTITAGPVVAVDPAIVSVTVYL